MSVICDKNRHLIKSKEFCDKYKLKILSGKKALYYILIDSTFFLFLVENEKWHL